MVDTQVAELLRQIREGNPAASNELIPLVYSELRRIASRHLSKERPNHTLQPTELVNEAYLKLFEGRSPSFADKAHFLAIASQIMRRILVDYARARNAEKRGGDVCLVALDGNVPDAETPNKVVELLELDLAIDALGVEDPRLAKSVELHYFGGLTAEEAAEATGLSVHSVRHDLRFAQAWLRRRLAGE